MTLDNGYFIFVCMGNICRSPFAEQYARQKFPHLLFDSFGTHVHTRESSPKDAVRAAQRQGIDLTLHQAKKFDQMPLPQEVNRYLAMDKKNIYRLKNDFAIPEHKIMLLDTPHEIEDPWSCGDAVYNKVYAQIMQAIDRQFGKNTFVAH